MSELIHGFVSLQAAQQPDHAAFEYLDETLTYRELEHRANQLAHQLAELGVRPGDRVGIYMPKAIDTPVALFGIMKAGAAYVPLDPSAPVERTAGLIRDCDINVLISSSEQRRALNKLLKSGCDLDALVGVDLSPDTTRSVPWGAVTKQPTTQPDVTVATDDLAYIIYTSGSTGTPKGIMHTHRSGLCFSHWAAREYGFTPDDRLSNHAPLHFDLSIMDYFSSVIAGATVVIVPEDYTKLPASYSALLADRRVSVLYTVPFALIQLLLRGALDQRDLSHLRYAIFGGEPFPTAHLRALMEALPHVRFDNIYGPAEVNGVSHYTVTTLPEDTESIPIGPIADHAVARVVDDTLQEVPVGEIGELLVSTASMMLGYWQQPELTSNSFYHCQESRRVFFRTGDLVSTLPGGLLMFVGRQDRQVKIRGYRVELDEVELALTALDYVEEGAAYTLDLADGSREIHAEITLTSTLDEASSVVRDLKQRLPWYAVPANVGVCDTFPRGATGKIDRKTLKINAQAALDGASDRGT